IETRDAVEAGRFACTIRSDQSGDLTRHHVERHVRERRDAAEAYRQILRGKNARAVHERAVRKRCSAPAIPMGMNNMIAISATPYATDESAGLTRCAYSGKNSITKAPMTAPHIRLSPPI